MRWLISPIEAARDSINWWNISSKQAIQKYLEADHCLQWSLKPNHSSYKVLWWCLLSKNNKKYQKKKVKPEDRHLKSKLHRNCAGRFRYWLAKILVTLKCHKRPIQDFLGYRRLGCDVDLFYLLALIY